MLENQIRRAKSLIRKTMLKWNFRGDVQPGKTGGWPLRARSRHRQIPDNGDNDDNGEDGDAGYDDTISYY